MRVGLQRNLVWFLQTKDNNMFSKVIRPALVPPRPRSQWGQLLSYGHWDRNVQIIMYCWDEYWVKLNFTLFDLLTASCWIQHWHDFTFTFTLDLTGLLIWYVLCTEITRLFWSRKWPHRQVGKAGTQAERNILAILDFKLSPCSVCCMLSFG